MLLDGLANIAQMCARSDLGDAEPEAFKGNFTQALGLNRYIANLKHAACIAVIALLDGRDIEIDDVAILQLSVAGNPMTYLVIDRGADGFG